MLISFIIPVYNRAAILHKCIDSILKSSWCDYELILVDDASTDGSGALCDQYEEQYSFIRTVHLPKNQGPGVARNYGLTLAQGEWIYFLDSDDQLYTENLEKIAQQIKLLPKKVNLIVANTAAMYDGTLCTNHNVQKFELLSAAEYLQKSPMCLMVTTGTYFFKRRTIVQNQVKFPSLYMHEDIIFIQEYFQFIDQVACFPVLIFWYQRDRNRNSLSNSNDKYSSYAYQSYFDHLYRSIQLFTEKRDLIRKYAYTQVLVIWSLYGILYKAQVLPVSAIVDQPHNLQIKETDSLPMKILHKILSRIKCEKCFLAPANQVSILLADYLANYGCTVVGMLDNFAPQVTTPQGRQIPVYRWDKAGAVCGDIPIYTTFYNYSWQTSLENKLYDYGLHVTKWPTELSLEEGDVKHVQL